MPDDPKNPGAYLTRGRAARTLIPFAQKFPDVGPIGLRAEADPAETAIVRAAVRRWLTLSHLINRFAKQPMEQLEPRLQAVLVAGAAELVLMRSDADFAVVDQTVELAKKIVRPKAAGMVNAIMRRLAESVGERDEDATWEPSPRTIPLDKGVVHLTQDLLPGVQPLREHVSVATGVPLNLVEAWGREFGPGQTVELSRHSLRQPPIVVAVEHDFDAAGRDDCVPHEEPGFVVWSGSTDGLGPFLDGHPARRVQDVAAAKAVDATRGLICDRIIDACAGRGTKTVQLRAEHPDARIIAAEPDPDRTADLTRRMAEDDKVTIVEPRQLDVFEHGGADLLVLDVPCSNTAVLARRPEARYRYSLRNTRSVVQLQKQILANTLNLLKPYSPGGEGSEGYILYTTCSLMPEENRQVAQWIAQQHNATIEAEELTLPGGEGTSYHDGAYHALIRCG